MISTIRNKTVYEKMLKKFLVAVFWIGVWQLIYLAVQQEILVVSPARVFQRLLELSGEEHFWNTVFSSMLRIISGFVLGMLFGALLAVLTSINKFIYGIFHPLISIIKATPVASFIVLALVWIKSPNVPIFTSFLMVTPIVWANIFNGIKKTDSNLLNMAKLYRFGKLKTVKLIYIPSVMPYFTAACTTGLGFSWKAGIAAEILANTPISIGQNIYDSKIYIETCDLFAWTAVVILMSVILEFLMVKLMKWLGRKYSVWG